MSLADGFAEGRQLDAHRQACVDAARALVGTPWRHRGRNERGIDCIGLIVAALRAGDFPIKDRIDYGREPWADGLRRELSGQFGEPLQESAWQPGDIVLFDLPGKEPCHVGILADYRFGGLSLIHAHSRHNVAEHGLDGLWRRLLVEVYSCRP